MPQVAERSFGTSALPTGGHAARFGAVPGGAVPGGALPGGGAVPGGAVPGGRMPVGARSMEVPW